LDADVNTTNTLGQTPLMLASQNGQLDVCELLLSKNGLLVDAKDNKGDTALSHAAQNGHLNTCKFLISKGANVNMLDADDCTPLMKAATNGRFDVCEYLVLDSRTSTDAKNKVGATALDLAKKWNHSEVVDLLRPLVKSPRLSLARVGSLVRMPSSLVSFGSASSSSTPRNAFLQDIFLSLHFTEDERKVYADILVSQKMDSIESLRIADAPGLSKIGIPLGHAYKILDIVKSRLGTDSLSPMSPPRVKKTVMISYQWDSKSLALRVREYLQRGTHKGDIQVIIDEGTIKHCTMSWMASSINRSDALILIMTPKYELSYNCKAEVQFAFKQQKKFIPICGEANYICGNGWLSFAIGTAIYYKILEDFETNMAKIVQLELGLH
jgi:ankyrin repeat protein